MTKKDVLSKLLFEGKSYRSYEDIEMLVQVEQDLSMVPIQPLYISLLASSTDQIAVVLPQMSPMQRQAFMDLDLWIKDRVDVTSFEYWIEVYSKVQDLELTQAFVESEDFLLYLKSRINLHTFDVEDPMYPDHDFYFLTDDMLLLVEYSEDYRYSNELRYLIRNLYDKHGVEGAYTMLFKLVNDSFPVLQEELYQGKKNRLRDLGFIDYYDALEKTHDFISVKQIESYIKKQDTLTPTLDVYAKNQSLHGSALVSFDEQMKSLYEELAKVTDEKRLSFLQFTFLRLVNSTITLNDALRGGSIELTRIGAITKNLLELGLDKVKSIRDFSDENSLFDQFDFFDLYRIGKTLIELEKKRIKKVLKQTPFENNDYEYFLGAWWGSFLENSDLAIPKVKTFGAGLHRKDVTTLETLMYWQKEIDLFCASIPFINSFFEMLASLKEEGKLHDEFYLNYNIENIDFESILISSFINFTLGHFSGTDVNKMGVSISELQKFFQENFSKKGEEYLIHELTDSSPIKQKTQGFITLFGLDSIQSFEFYLHGILREHLSGYEFDTLEDEDFKHIGGPILLNSLIEN